MSDTLLLDEDAACRCIETCRAYIQGLQGVRLGIINRPRQDGFGTLPSGRALAAKFTNLAVGPTGSLQSVLEQHIQVITNLIGVFEQAARNYAEADDQTRAALHAASPERP